MNRQASGKYSKGEVPTIHKDCFAFRPNEMVGECDGLTFLVCRHHECPFYKNKATHQAMQLKIDKQLARRNK